MLIPAWVSNNMPSKEWDEITYIFPNPPMDSPHKEPVMRKSLRCHDVIISIVFLALSHPVRIFCGLYHTRIHDDIIKIETFSALQALWAGNSPVTGEFPAQRASDTELWCFLWSAPEWGWWSETPLHPLWRHCNVGNCLLSEFFQGFAMHYIPRNIHKVLALSCFAFLW